MLKVVIVTCLPRDMASLCLPELAHRDGIDVGGVVLVTGGETKNRRYYWRKLKKVLKIGLLGAWNGKRIRPWFRKEYEDLKGLCQLHRLPFFEVAQLNGAAMQKLLERLAPDVGLSLGNGFIAERIFSIPKYGFVNVHSEILPQYQNAQSIIWPIYRMDPYSGFTIHEVARKIDAGRILYQKRMPLVIYPKLRDTVYCNKTEIEKLIPGALADVCVNFEHYREKAREQSGGGHYTTPSFWQFLRMVMNNRRLYRRSKGRS